MSATGVIDVIGIGQIIAAFLQFFKVVLERWLKPTDPLHDPAIQLSAGIIGVVGYVLHAATLAPLSGAVFWDQAGTGFLSGLSAIVSYHILSSATVTQTVGDMSVSGKPKDLAALAAVGTAPPTNTVGVKPLTAAAITPAKPDPSLVPLPPVDPNWKPYEPPKPADPVAGTVVPATP